MKYSIKNILLNKFNLTRLCAFVLTTIISIGMGQVAYADVTARLDRSHIYNGDTITLHITASGKDIDKQPDLSPLKKNFDVLGTSSSSQIQIINGYRTDKHEWQIELAPRSRGKLTIPALTVGNSSTLPLTLTVSDQNTSPTSQAGQPVFIKSEIGSDPGNAYVQQQILYTTRLYYRVPLVEGSFTDPKIDNAVVEQLGKDKQYNTTVKGQSYQVLERSYAIFPEHSGTLTIPAVVFNGRTVTQQQQSPFGQMDNMFQQMLNQSGFNSSLFNGTAFGSSGKRVHFASNSITLPIKPQPANYSGSNWLPTQSMKIQDSWTKAPPVIHAGEPVTRSLTLTAKGLEASQLPEITLPGPGSVKIYPEKAKQSNHTDGDWVYGQREQRFTYVSSQPGKVSFPAVKITWWNTLTHKEMMTTLPAYDVTVLPGSGQASTTPGTPVVTQITQPVAATATTQTRNIKSQVPATTKPSQTSHDKSLYWLILGILIFTGFVVVAYFIYRQRRHNNPEPSAVAQENSNTIPVVKKFDKQAEDKHLKQALHDACKNNQPNDVAKLLLDYAAITWPDNTPRSLSAIASLSEKASDELIKLENVLYSSRQSDWNGQLLWDSIKDGLISKPTKRNTEKQDKEVPQLYPDWKNMPKKTG